MLFMTVAAGARAEEMRARDIERDAIEPQAFLQRPGLGADGIDRCAHMVLQILADMRLVELTSIPWPRKLVGIADTRKHQQLRRVDRAAG